MSATQGTTRELAQLLSIVRSHPAMPPGMREGLDGLLSESMQYADPYASPEGIEIYLEARTRLDQRTFGGEA